MMSINTTEYNLQSTLLNLIYFVSIFLFQLSPISFSLPPPFSLSASPRASFTGGRRWRSTLKSLNQLTSSCEFLWSWSSSRHRSIFIGRCCRENKALYGWYSRVRCMFKCFSCSRFRPLLASHSGREVAENSLGRALLRDESRGNSLVNHHHPHEYIFDLISIPRRSFQASKVNHSK